MRLMFAALFAAPFALAHPAQAQVRAQGQVSNFRYVLTDLTPGDGQAAAIRIDAPDDAIVRGSIWDGKNVDLNGARQGIASLENTVEWPGNARVTNSYSAGLDAFGSGVGLSLEILPAQIEFAALTGQAHSPFQSFSVAPHTAITISVDVSLMLSMGPESDRWHHQSNLYGGMTLLASPAGQGGFFSSDLLRGWVGNSDYGPYRLEDNESRTISLSFENTSDAWVPATIDYWMDGTADAWTAAAPPSPVPEPQEWAMLLAGAALAVRASRRAHRRKTT